MFKNVIKRNGQTVDFDSNKIKNAILKAMSGLDQRNIDVELADKTTKKVLNKIKQTEIEVPSVDQIHIFVENSLMDLKQYELAREYITYRNNHKPDIFKKRINIKPYEYPDLIDYQTAIQHSYWLFSEFNYDPDIQDMKINLNNSERSAINRSMLAISQIESAVKTFWGDVHKKLPKPEIAKVGSVFSECHIDNTEILTPHGWKDLKDTYVGDSVMQYNENNTISETKVKETFNNYYEGYVYKFTKGNSFETHVTPNHRMLYYDNKNNFKEINAKYFYTMDKKVTIPETGSLTNDVNNLSEEDKNNIKLYKDFDWVDLSDKSFLWCKEFLEELKNYKNKNELKFYDNNKSNIDKLQIIGICAGYKTHIHTPKNKSYYITFKEKSKNVSYSKFKEEIYDYAGIVRCVSVDSGAIITRYNNKVFIAGNSEVRHEDTYSHLIEIMGLNEEFQKLLEVPAMKKRIRYLEQVNQNIKSVDPRDFFETIILFSMFIENVSLFSQFLIIMSFNKHKNLLKGMSNGIEATSKEECYIKGTEIFTPNGWIALENVNQGDVVYQYNNHNLERVQVLHKTEKDFSGNLIHFYTDDYQCFVTPEHDMIYHNKFTCKRTDIDRPEKEIIKTKAKNFQNNNSLVPVYNSNKLIDHIEYIDNSEINKEEIPYKGKVYCVSVPSGAILTRYDNKSFIAGNCIHAQFGFDLINIIKNENPHWWTDELQTYIKDIALDAYNAELEVVEWIYENGDIDIIPKAVTKEYIKKRINDSLESIGIEKIFDIENGLISYAEWFEDEILVDKATDFFNKRVTNYQKRSSYVDADDIF